jgi:ubiquitin carboxyl-terminal hydrolase 8
MATISDSSEHYEIIEDYKKEEKNEVREETIYEKRKKITVLGLSGLVNLGNTCFMNAALQCLSASDLLTSYLVGTGNDEAALYKEDLKNGVIMQLMEKYECDENDLDDREIRKYFKNSLTYMIRKLFVLMWNENCRVKPRTFKTALGQKKAMFRGYQQHDSQECLSFILDQIHEETKTDARVRFVKMNEEYKQYNEYYDIYMKNMKKEKISKEEKTQIYREYVDNKKDKEKIDAVISSLYFWKGFLKNNHSSIIDIFTGLFLTKFKCEKCSNTSMKFDPYNIIPLHIPNLKFNEKCTLEKCLDGYFLEENKLTEDNKYSCEYCDEKTDANIKTDLWSVPSRLIIQLKRFTTHGSRNNANIEFPIDNLNLEKYYCEYSKKNNVYDLYGVIMHHGSMHFGHYVAFTKNPINDEWYHFDDSDVLHIPKNEIENAIQNHAAYVLFYKKRK